MTGTDLPRLAPLPRDQWDDEVRQAFEVAFNDVVAARFFSTGADVIPMPNVLATLMHHPGLMGPFLAYNQVLLQEPALDHRRRELLVLRVAWRTQAPYEWAQHVRLATGIGITAEEIAAIPAGAGAEVWTPHESDLLAAADQLIDGYRIDDETWERLAQQLDSRQLVELVFVVGTYTGLAMAFNSFGVQVDPELREIAGTSLPESEE